MNLIYIVIAAIIIVIAAIYLQTQENFSDPIDIVYTWVDNYDPEREEAKDLLGLPPGDANLDSARYDANEEMRYSIRSVFEYCGEWLGKIYIVVKDGQVPQFLDFSNPQLVLVNHSEIIPKYALPTFNSNAIELCIHKIKNLSKIYVYFNDDLFLGAPFHPVKNGKICINVIAGKPIKAEKAKSNEQHSFNSSLHNTNYYGKKLLDADINIRFAHTPSVCYKPWEQEMEDLLRANKLWEETLVSKFRQNSNIITSNCFRIFFYLKKKNKVEVVNWGDVYNDLKQGQCEVQFAPHFVVATINQECAKAFKYQMEQIYPIPSPVEQL